MTLVPRSFYELERWFDEEFPELVSPLGNILPRTIGLKKVPRINMYEKDENLVVEAEMPGLKPEDINVEIKDGVLRIEGKVEEEKEERGKDFYRKEISSTYQARTVMLPAEVKEDEIEAEYKNGILKVVMPKKEEKKVEGGRKIKVKG
ncbi:Acid shock protein [bacterium HR34]|nr:Acid shock protein [bacterium HR34]